jgi:tetratricopeptide (TPR) repeat protein
MSAHYWIAAPSRAERDRLRSGLVLPPVLAAVDGHRRLRGPYTAAGTLLRQICADALTRIPELGPRHYIELQESTPELAPLLPPLGRASTQSAPGLGAPGEKNRFPARLHTLRISHGLTDFLRDYLATLGGGPRTLLVHNAQHADATDKEFLAVLLRRLTPDQLTVVIETGIEPPSDPPGIVAASLSGALIAYATRVDGSVDGSVEGSANGSAHEPSAAPSQAPGHEAEPATSAGLARAYVDGDGTSEDPAQVAAYAGLDPEARATLHDRRATELAALGEPSLELGAIPYHLELGSGPRGAVVQALRSAQHRCKTLGFYHAAVDFGERGRRVVDLRTQPELWWPFTRDAIASLAAGGRPEESKAMQDEARRCTWDPTFHMKLAYETGMLYARHFPEAQRDVDAARAWVNQAIAFAALLPDPKERSFYSVFNRNGLALVEVRAGNADEALRLVDEGIARLDRELDLTEQVWHRIGLRYNRAQVNSMTGRLEAALADYAEVLDADEDFADHYFNRGSILRRLGRIEEAIADFTRALRLEPPFPEAYYNRADAWLELGELERALADFDRALELDPDHVDALVNRTGVLADLGDAQRALRSAEAGLLLAPDNAALLCLRGRLLREQGALDQARDAVAAALLSAPDLAEAWALRGEIAYAAGDLDAAAADLDRAVGLGDLPEIRFNRAVVYEAAGRFSEAAADYDAVLTATEDADARLHRDSCLRAAERADC